MNIFLIITLAFLGLVVVIGGAFYQNKADVAKTKGKKFIK